MKIIYKLSELDKVKKIYIALGLDTKKLDDRAIEFKKQIKTDAQIKAEIKAEVDKVKP